jgi:ATP-dependent RNA helicase DeaD
MSIVEECTGFKALGLKEGVLEGLIKAGFKTPSPIQEEVIPLILNGSDVIGHAQTGTGKTAAFALPALHLLKNTGTPEVLVITPTRELASQVSEEISRLGRFIRAKTATVYGGKSFLTQIDAIKRGAHVVVATPGRLLDLLKGKKIGEFNPSLVIIDEADEMLDMGFLEDLQAIFDFLPEERQTLMFSATMPPAIQSLAKKTLKSPIVVKAAGKQATNEDITQHYCVLQDSERDEAIVRLFEADEMFKAVIFCKTKKEVDRLSQVLSSRGQAASGLHGDMEQNQRESVTRSFRNGQCKILVATDVAARGLNIVDVSHVINYHIPFDAENYVHRIGRTGRAGRKGTSITFVTSREYSKLLRFQKITGGKLERFFIPSKQEIRQSQIQRVVSQVDSAKAAADVSAIINALEQDSDDFAKKLVTWVLSKNPIEGPETIGLLGAISAPSYNRDPRDRGRSFGSRARPAYSGRTPHSGRTERSKSDSFGSYAKKKFTHPAESRKAKKKF